MIGFKKIYMQLSESGVNFITENMNMVFQAYEGEIREAFKNIVKNNNDLEKYMENALREIEKMFRRAKNSASFLKTLKEVNKKISNRLQDIIIDFSSEKSAEKARKLVYDMLLFKVVTLLHEYARNGGNKYLLSSKKEEFKERVLHDIKSQYL